MKVSAVEEEKVGSSAYKRVITKRHLPLMPSMNLQNALTRLYYTLQTAFHADPAEEDCKDLDVLVRQSCQCPLIAKGNIYVLVISKDALSETTLRNFRYVAFLNSVQSDLIF